MLDMDEIRSEILRLENGKTTYPVLEKLSVLYSVYNQNDVEKNERIVQPEYSYAAAPSEFMDAVRTAPINQVLEILDEHMEAVQVLYPKEYNSVLRKIKALA